MSKIATEWLFNRSIEENKIQEWMAQNGLSILYSIEDENHLLFVTEQASNPIKCPLHDFISSRSIKCDIDWKNQWQLAASITPALVDCGDYFRFDLSIACKDPKLGSFNIVSGAGFGDFSHPTTQIMLDLMYKNCENRDILDIGSGSGILSFASALMGAKSIMGIDTDKDAIKHSIQSQKINPQLDTIVFSYVSPDDNGPNIPIDFVLINMIFSEQKVAWKSVVKNLPRVKDVCLSGILEDEEHELIDFVKQYGFYVDQRICKDGWMGFLLKQQKRT